MWHGIWVASQILLGYMAFSCLCGGVWIGVIELSRRYRLTYRSGLRRVASDGTAWQGVE